MLIYWHIAVIWLYDTYNNIQTGTLLVGLCHYTSLKPIKYATNIIQNSLIYNINIIMSYLNEIIKYCVYLFSIMEKQTWKVISDCK